MKKIVVGLLSLVLILTSFTILSACGKERERVRTKYEMELYLDVVTHELTGEQTTVYCNNSDEELDRIVFALHLNAYGKDGNVVDDAGSTGYPYGDNYAELEIGGVKVDGIPAETAMTDGGHYMEVLLDKPLKRGQTAKVELSYRALIPKNDMRTGYNSVGYNLGNFYPVAVVYGDGKWVKYPYYVEGDPFFTETADYEVRLTTSRSYSVFMTGNETYSDGERGQIVESSAQNVRDFAIEALFGVTVKETQVDGVKLRYAGKRKCDEALALAADCLAAYSELFGKYPYDSLDVVETAFCEGGMEYPNLVTVASGLDDREREHVIAHEIAHQWWYGVVGNDQVAEPWLDEGLAEYSVVAYLRGRNRAKEADALLESAKDGYVYYYSDAAEQNHKMRRALSEYPNSAEYVCQAYAKGMMMYDAVEKAIGREATLRALRRYYAENMYGVATEKELIAAFNEESYSGKMIEKWLEGKNLIF